MMLREHIDAALAARLVAEQFPQWADLPVVPVELDGWDNRTFRLGDIMTVRLPTAKGYAAAVEKELTWLPRLAPALPYPIPVPIAAGAPSATYPWPWSIRRWLHGQPASVVEVGDTSGLAQQLADFLRALQRADTMGGPLAGAQTFYRGSELTVYDDETRAAIAALAPRIDAYAATEAWEAALGAPWTGPPVWFHGDFAPGNILLDGTGALGAVLDFGQCGVGDPACDVVIAWTLFHGRARDVFRESLEVDDAMWRRGRGWALWKALITLQAADADVTLGREPHELLCEILADDV